MSANLVVDLGNTCIYRHSVGAGSGFGGLVGEIIDLGHGNTNCQVYCAGIQGGSGSLPLLVQTSDLLTSGSFTDPTSGLAQMPSILASGGVFVANSGLWVSGGVTMTAPVDNAPLFCSGGIMFGHFQRPHRYARLVALSGAFPAGYSAGFVTNSRTVGSGGGSTQSPGSGVINV